MPIQFEQPGWLLLAVLLVPVWIWHRRGREAFSPGRWMTIGMLRSLLILLLAVAMAEPIIERRAQGLTVVVVLDRSRSMPRSKVERAVAYLEEAANGPQRLMDDRLAVVQVGRDAVPTAMPDPASVISLATGPADVTETNLAAGIEQAKGLLPNDTASRIVLVSDGNETIGSLEAAANIARDSGIPIDVLPVEFRYEEEVLIDRLMAPSHARLEQSIELRVVLRSQSRSQGKLVLHRDDVLIDINGDAPGSALPLTLEGGLHVERITVDSSRPGPVKFLVSFEPDPGLGNDRVAANNTAAAVTFVSGDGAVLVLDEGGGGPLLEALQAAGISAFRSRPDELTNGVVGLLGFDAIAMVNLPRWSLTESQVLALHAYVHDTGGGLLVTGGPESFGAGGWIGSALEPAMPVDLDPPAERQIVKGALAIIVHSCEMPQGNYWGRRVAEAAIETLNAADDIGLIEKGGQGATWVYRLQPVGDRVGALSAAKQLTFGDMQMFQPSMQMALQGLVATDAGQRHVIIISDGDPQPPSANLLTQYVDNGVTCTTIMVGGHGNNALHEQVMQRIATITGGTYYRVKDPSELPSIFIKEARVVSRSLIQEGRFETEVADTLSGPVQGLGETPPVNGYVLTAARDGLARIGLTVVNEDHHDPLYAWWNYGLGRVVAFTGEVNSRWGSAWLAWPRNTAFWEQTMRYLMRSSSRSELAIDVTDEGGGQYVVEVEAFGSDQEALNFLETKAVVIGPDGTTTPLRLQQIGPGRYRGSFQQRQAGTSVVNVNYAGRDGQGEAISGNLQAAAARTYSDEYRDLVDNAALLRRIAAQTGGRVLAIDDLAPADLFDRGSLVMPSTATAIWNTLAVIAAILLILDVAARRLAVDPQRVRDALAHAAARKQGRSDASLSAWRRTKKSARSRTAISSDPPDGAAEPSSPNPARSGSTLPTEPPAPPSGSAPIKPDAGPVDDDGDSMTSRLRAARDRARRDTPEGTGQDSQDESET